MWVRDNKVWYEVEKMYKTIFGEFAPNCGLCVKLIDCKIFNNTHNCNKFECDYQRLFTAEKQLNIIKWLLKSYDIGLSQLGERIDTSLDGVNCISGLGSGNTFEESLAQAINDLWQDLTDTDKVQIKEILE